MLGSLLAALTLLAGYGLLAVWYQWQYRRVLAESRGRVAKMYRDYGIRTIPGQPHRMAEADPFPVVSLFPLAELRPDAAVPETARVASPVP